MNNITNYNDVTQFYDFLTQKKIKNNLLDSGTEGICYLSSIDRLVYKILYNKEYYSWINKKINRNAYLQDEYIPTNILSVKDIESIIMESDINIKSFLFPIQLFVCENNLLGYSTRYCSKNLFSDKYTSEIEYLRYLDFNKIKKAYYKMMKDVEKLSDENILIIDLSYNLLFDGNNFFGIDTCWYRREKNSTIIKNLETYKNALIDIFEVWTGEFRDSDVFKNDDIEEYLKDIEKNYVKVKRYY